MEKINYTLLELIRYNQQLTDLLEYALLEYQHDKELTNQHFFSMYYEYENGFLNRIFEQYFKKPKRIKKALKSLFKYHQKNEKFSITGILSLQSQLVLWEYE